MKISTTTLLGEGGWRGAFVATLLAIFLTCNTAGAVPSGFLRCESLPEATERPPLQFKVYRGLRGCRDWDCLRERVRPSKNRLNVVVAKNVDCSEARASWGNYGWARENIALVCDLNQIPNAFLLAHGVENFEIGVAPNWVIQFAIEDHWDYVAEIKCKRKTVLCKRARRNGQRCIGSFNEIQLIPGEQTMGIELVAEARDLLNIYLKEQEPGEPNPNLPPEDQWEFKGCNLWKPEGDNAPKTLRVLIRGDWPKPDRVEAMRKDGTWEVLQDKGLSNYCGPNALERHTYAGDHPGGPAYAGKRAGGGLRVWYGSDFAFIPLPGPPKNRHE